ncbi:outer membrane lipoprotein LolB [Pseudoalteromonas sp. MMG010]|uniref:lipoprotein insertase outer membrane protein LolB n=1 Tax=Pseudoalteromonas sp. MMG010 TaxID=2822685 RepID=UPI001B39E855|nr:lipoprotein insertase outer membrane protein LolB [Pseudoalteromonas sp. MMG010]MBQ4834524.1 outer membrane lipoprotein LolB [Pseudoalteromonas sp. MMG010]
MIRHSLILTLFFLFLSGCAQKTATQTVLYADWKTRLANQQTWHIKGKLAFISPDERQSANLNWQQFKNKNTLSLTSFIGIQVLALEQTPDQAHLKFDGEEYKARDAQQLLQQLTGLTLPLNKAGDWLKGTSNSANLLVDELGRARSVSWLDNSAINWHIDYSNYIQENGFWLPTKLTLTHQKIKIKIQINNWQFN